MILHICDFCGKDEHAVRKVVACGRLVKAEETPKALPCICNECIDLCGQIMRDDPAVIRRAMNELL